MSLCNMWELILLTYVLSTAHICQLNNIWLNESLLTHKSGNHEAQ